MDAVADSNAAKGGQTLTARGRRIAAFPLSASYAVSHFSPCLLKRYSPPVGLLGRRWDSARGSRNFAPTEQDYCCDRLVLSRVQRQKGGVGLAVGRQPSKLI